MIPIGSVGRVPKFPVVTVGLSLLIVIAYIFQSDSEDSLRLEVDIAAKTQIRENQRQLFIEYCTKSQKLKPKKCSEVSTIATRKYYHLDLYNQQKAIESNLKKKHGEKWWQWKPMAAKDKRYMNLQKQAKSYQQLSIDVASAEEGSELFPYRQAVKRFFEGVIGGDWGTLVNLTAFSKFREAYMNHRRMLRSIHKKARIFSPLNVNPLAALESVFRHGGWMHVLGNLLVFIALGRYVEMFLGGLAFTMLFLVGGLLGAYGYTTFSPELSMTGLVGASGGAYAVAAAFLVFFRNRHIGVWMFPFPFVAFVPPTLIFPLFFLAGDIAGLKPNVLGLGGVAHTTHLVGFLVGGLLAYIAVLLQAVKWPFLYPFEKNDFHRFREEKDFEKKLQMGNRILSYQPGNLFVKIELLVSLVQQPLSMRSQTFVQKNLVSAFDGCINKGFDKWAYMLLKCIPVHFPLKHLMRGDNLIESLAPVLPGSAKKEPKMRRLGQRTSLKLAKIAFVKQDYVSSLRMLNYYLESFELAESHKEALQAALVITKLCYQIDRVQFESLKSLVDNGELLYLKVVVGDVERTATQELAVAAGAESLYAPAPRSLPIDPKSVDFPEDVDEDLLFDGSFINRLLAFYIDFTVQSALLQILVLAIPAQVDAFIKSSIWFVGGSLVFFFYTILPLARNGQTMGKKAAKIKLVQVGNPSSSIGIGKAIAREMIKLMLVIFFWPVGVIALFVFKNQERSRAFYDKWLGLRMAVDEESLRSEVAVQKLFGPNETI